MRFNHVAITIVMVLMATIPLSNCGGAANPLSAPDFGVAKDPSTDPTKNYFGMNVGFLTDWDSSFAFVDAMKHARPWQDATDWHMPVGGVDDAGWPTSDASTVILTGTPRQFNGTYKLSFQGQADISFLWSTGRVENQVYQASTNTTTADVTFDYNTSVTDSRSVGLTLTNTRRVPTADLHSGFTGMHLYRPGYPADGSVTFTTPFLNALKSAKVIRMMEWSSANQNVTQHWSQRTRPDDMYRPTPRYFGPSGGQWAFDGSGSAIEYQIILCNDTQADCWFNIPVTADDDYIRKFALAIRYGTDGVEPYESAVLLPKYPPLHTASKIYLEFGNENWNSGAGFFNLSILEDIVKSLAPNHPVNTPALDNLWFRIWRYCAYRSSQISDIFRVVFGDDNMFTRIRPVLMTQQGNGQSTIHDGLEWLDQYAIAQKPPRQVASYLYGAGGSGYYGVNQDPPNRSNADAFFAPSNYPATSYFDAMAIDALWAVNYGLRRIAYEGGPSLDAYGQAAKVLDMDPRMQDMIVKSHDAWSSVGGDLLTYYKIVGAPEWEFTNDISITNTPKLRALLQLLSQPRGLVTLGAPLPGTIIPTDGQKWQISNFYGYTTNCSGQPCIYGGRNPGDWTGSAAHSDQAFRGQLSVTGLGVEATTFGIWINGQLQGQVALAKGDTLATTNAVPVQVPQGLVVVRLAIISGSANIRSINLNRP